MIPIFLSGFALRFVQDSHQMFFWNLSSGIANDSVIFANALGWIRTPKKDLGSALLSGFRKDGKTDLLIL